MAKYGYGPTQGLLILMPLHEGGRFHGRDPSYIMADAEFPLLSRPFEAEGYQRCTFTSHWYAGGYRFSDVKREGPTVWYGDPITRAMVQDPALVEERQLLKYLGKAREMLARVPDMSVFVVVTPSGALNLVRPGDMVEPVAIEEVKTGRITITHTDPKTGESTTYFDDEPRSKR